MNKTLKSIFGGVADFILKQQVHIKQGTSYNANTWKNQAAAKRSPFSSCFSHCSAWLLQNAGKQTTPDAITEALNDYPYYKAWAAQHYGASVARSFAGNMQTLWELQLKYINDALGSGNRAFFDGYTEIAELKAYIQRAPVIVGTSPMYQGKVLGHIMLIVGVTDTGWIVDDPFGDFRNGYASKDGDNLQVSFEDFEKIRGKLSIHLLNKI